MTEAEGAGAAACEAKLDVTNQQGGLRTIGDAQHTRHGIGLWGFEEVNELETSAGHVPA